MERWLQARLLLVVLLLILESVLEGFGILFVLYDAVLGIEWIGDETLTWVHKHYGITYWGDVSRVGKREFATGGWRALFIV